MSYAGNEEPCAYGELVSIGGIGGEKNKKAGGGGGVRRAGGAGSCSCCRRHRRQRCQADSVPAAAPSGPLALAAACSQISAALAAVVQQHLGVPPSRLYIKFFDVARSDFGWNGSTF